MEMEKPKKLFPLERSNDEKGPEKSSILKNFNKKNQPV